MLRLGDRWVSLPPVEARLTAALLERFGAVVSRDALARSGWPGGSPGRNALDVHVLRLRRRLSPLRLAIRTVRSRGYLLERADGGGQVAPDQIRPGATARQRAPHDGRLTARHDAARSALAAGDATVYRTRGTPWPPDGSRPATSGWDTCLKGGSSCADAYGSPSCC